MTITYLGHACFLFEVGETKILTDPFLDGNPNAPCSSGAVSADYIFVSHGHRDHVGDAAKIAKRCGSVIVSTADLAPALFPDKKYKTLSGNLGGWAELPFGRVKFVSALHSSGVPGALACGFVFDMGGKRIYFAGDTALTCDMALLKDEAIDLALLPIGDFYTMGPADAIRAAKLIEPKQVVPMHYDSFSAIRQDADKFAADCTAAGFPCTALGVGKSMEL